MAIPLPAKEAQRAASLRSYEILDTPPDQALDDITRLAAQVCEAPIALITLVDADRQWFKSNVGFPFSETSRELSFCALAILHAEQVMIVPDALKDARFSHNPLVTDDPQIRFQRAGDWRRTTLRRLFARYHCAQTCRRQGEAPQSCLRGIEWHQFADHSRAQPPGTL